MHKERTRAKAVSRARPPVCWPTSVKPPRGGTFSQLHSSRQWHFNAWTRRAWMNAGVFWCPCLPPAAVLLSPLRFEASRNSFRNLLKKSCFDDRTISPTWISAKLFAIDEDWYWLWPECTTCSWESSPRTVTLKLSCRWTISLWRIRTHPYPGNHWIWEATRAPSDVRSKKFCRLL